MAENVVLNITANLRDNTRQGLTGLRGRLGSLRENSKLVSGSLQAIKVGAVALGATVGILAAVGSAAFALTSQYAAQADELSKLSQRTGVAAEDLSALRHAAEQSDVPFEMLQAALFKFNEAQNRAASDGGKLRGELEALGASAYDLDTVFDVGAGLNEKLFAFADVVADAGGALDQAALAAKIFGPELGPKLLPLLAGGADGLVAFREEAEALGIIISQDAADQAADFGDAIDEMQKAASGLAIQVGMHLVPILTILARKAIPFITRAVKVVGPIVSGLGAIFGFLLEKIFGVVDFILNIAQPAFTFLGQVLSAIGDALAFNVAPHADVANQAIADLALGTQLASETVVASTGAMSAGVGGVGTASCLAAAASNGCLSKIGDVGEIVAKNLARTVVTPLDAVLAAAEATADAANAELEGIGKGGSGRTRGETPASNIFQQVFYGLTQGASEAQRQAARSVVDLGGAAGLQQGRSRQRFLESNFFGDEQNRNALTVQLNHLSAIREHLASISGMTSGRQFSVPGSPGGPGSSEDRLQYLDRPGIIGDPADYGYYGFNGISFGPGQFQHRRPNSGAMPSSGPIIIVQTPNLIGDPIQLAQQINDAVAAGFIGTGGGGGGGSVR